MWKNLIYEGITYENFLINENGDIKNLKTNHIYKKVIHKKDGYIIITLPMGKRGKTKSIRLHKALAETFIPNPNNYPIVHHKDENKENYSLENLEWTTCKKNIEYHLKELSKETPFFNNRKLTKEDVEYIRKQKGLISYSELAIKFDVSKTTINNIMNNKYYNF